MKQRIRHIIEFMAFIILSSPLVFLPSGLSVKAGRLLGTVVFHLWGKRRRIAVENMREAKRKDAIADPRTPEELIKENFRSLGRWVSEISKVYFGIGDGIVRGIKVEGRDNYERARQKGKGVILVTGHCGNWELLSISISSKVGRVCGVVKKQSNPYINRFIVKARKRYDTDIVYKEGALRKFISMLKNGETVGVLMDQAVFPSEGVLVDFLGSPAWTTRMPVALAKRTGAALVPVFIRLTESGHEIIVHPEVELAGDDERDTAMLSSYVEDYIKENPTHWLWIHRRWKRAGGREVTADTAPA